MAKTLTILITGTRKGIGRHLVNYYRKKNYRVIGCSRGAVDYEFENYEHYKLDVSNERSVKKMFMSIRKKYRRLDILINNAGLASMNHILLTPPKDVEKIMNINFVSLFHITKESVKIMRANGESGRIINLVSIASSLNIEGESVYIASKSAVSAFTRSMVRELSPFGITINAIGVPLMNIGLVEKVPLHLKETILSKQGFKRFGETKDISNVISFLMKEESSYISGQIINLAGVPI